MPFRVAIGRCSAEPPYRDQIGAKACELVNETVSAWRVRLPADVQAFPLEFCEEVVVAGFPASLEFFRQEGEEGAQLLVVQLLVHTWRRPTYFAVGAVGRLFAEGLRVSPTGAVSRAVDEEMWGFR